MKKFFSVLVKLFAVVFAIMFVVMAVLALLLFNLERKLFNPQTYIHELAKQNFYERMPAIVAQALASANFLNTCERNPIACGAGERSAEGNECFESALGAVVYQEISSNARNPTPEELRLADACLEQYGLDQVSGAGGPPAYMTNLSAADWEFILSSILPAEDLKNLTEQGLESVIAFFNGKTDSATLSLAPLKARLSSEAGVEAVLQMMEAQPECTESQMFEMGLAMLEEPKIPMCNPPDELNKVIKPLIQGQLQMVAAELPDQVTLIPAPVSEQADPRGGLTTIRIGMRLSPLLALVFLLGVTLFAVRNLKSWLTWWGVPFVITGVLSALLGLVGSSLLRSFIQRRMVEGMPAQLPAIVAQSVNDLISAIIRQLTRPVVWQGILLATIGIGMLFLAFYKSYREAKRLSGNAEARALS